MYILTGTWQMTWKELTGRSCFDLSILINCCKMTWNFSWQILSRSHYWLYILIDNWQITWSFNLYKSYFVSTCFLTTYRCLQIIIIEKSCFNVSVHIDNYYLTPNFTNHSCFVLSILTTANRWPQNCGWENHFPI